MSMNGDHPTVEADLLIDDPVREGEGSDFTPSSRQSILHHHSFLKKLRVLHYLGNLYTTRVVPAFEERERLRTEEVDWVKLENERREARRSTNETEIRQLRGQREDLQREREEAEAAYA